MNRSKSIVRGHFHTEHSTVLSHSHNISDTIESMKEELLLLHMNPSNWADGVVIAEFFS